MQAGSPCRATAGPAARASTRATAQSATLRVGPYPDLVVTDANQEHGIVALRPGATAMLPALSLGALVRVLPNHACATCAAYDRYHVLDGDGARRRGMAAHQRMVARRSDRRTRIDPASVRAWRRVCCLLPINQAKG